MGRAVWSDATAADRRARPRLKTLNLVRAPEILQEVSQGDRRLMIADPTKWRAARSCRRPILELAAAKRMPIWSRGLTLNNDREKNWTLALYSVQQPLPDVASCVRSAEAVRDFVAASITLRPGRSPGGACRSRHPAG